MSDAWACAVLAVILPGAQIPAAPERSSVAPGPAEMLEAADAPHDSFAEGLIRMRLTVEEKPGKSAVSEVDLFVEGNDRSLAVIREGKQKGRRILTSGNGVWLIVPGSSRAIPVTSNQRLMGAASFGDIARLRFAESYDATLRPSEEMIPDAAGEVSCRVLDLKAKRATESYPAGTLWVGREDGLARKLRLSLASGKEAKEILFARYRRGDTASEGSARIERMEIRDLLSKAGPVTVEFQGYEPRTLDERIFTPEGAREVP